MTNKHEKVHSTGVIIKMSVNNYILLSLKRLNEMILWCIHTMSISSYAIKYELKEVF